MEARTSSEPDGTILASHGTGERALPLGSGAPRPTSLLTFSVGELSLALATSAVAQVVRAVAVSRLPKAPPIVEGVINFRGRIVPVLDVRRRFGQPPRPIDPDQHFIIAQAGRRLVVIRVDRAIDIVEVETAAIESGPPPVPGAELLGGIARLPDGLLVIHDLDAFLALDEGAALDAALTQAGE